MPYVLSVDQRRSRHGRDLVDDTLRTLEQRVRQPLLGFERTAGDEFQGVLATAADALETTLLLVREGTWSIGLGLGPVEHPLPSSTRSARGAAFIRARDALDAAKSRPDHLAVGGSDDADALLSLIAAVLTRRSAAGWEAIDLVERGFSLAEAAAELGVSRQAVGQRLAVALWQQEKAVHSLAIRILEEAAT